MKQRNVLAVILFSIITLGIYDLFWLVKTKDVLNKETDIHTPSIWLLFSPLILVVAALIALVALGGSGGGNGSGSSGSLLIGFVLYMLAILLFIPISFYWFLKFSKAVNHYTHGELSTAITFILLYVLRFIGLAIIQDKFNDMLQAGGPTSGVTPQYAGMPGGSQSPAAGAFGAAPQMLQQPQQFMPPQAPVQPTMDNPWPQQPQAQMPESPVVTPTAPAQSNDGSQPPQPPTPPLVQ